MEIVIGLLAVVAVIAVAGLLFIVWVTAEVTRGLWRLIRPKKRESHRRVTGRQACNNRDCRGDNPDHARFCRRCGRPLPALMRLVDARAA